MIFEESKAWNWKVSAQSDPTASIFEVEQYTVVGHAAENAENEAAESGEAADGGFPVQNSPQQDQWSINAEQIQETPPGSPLVQGIQFSTPPTGQSLDRCWSEIQNCSELK